MSGKLAEETGQCTKKRRSKHPDEVEFDKVALLNEVKSLEGGKVSIPQTDGNRTTENCTSFMKFFHHYLQLGIFFLKGRMKTQTHLEGIFY